MKNNTIKAGIVQFDVKLGEVDANIDAATNGLNKLGNEGVGLAVLPEMWSCGFDNANLKMHAKRTPEILDTLSGIALDHDMLIAGSMPEYADGKVYNTLYIVESDGSVCAEYRKIHLFSLTEEPRYFGSGDSCVVCDTSVGRIGLMICYDFRFPELCRTLALKGAQIVIVPAEWPRARIGQWEVLAQARAIENQLFIIAANRCGKDPILTYGGHSQIVAPKGDVIAAAGKEPENLHAEIDFKEIKKFRKIIPCLNERVVEAYDLQNPAAG